jgi:anti-sigma factor RsiW
MSCSNKFVELMHKYLDSEMTSAEEKILKEHLVTCEDCQNHFHELKRTVTLLQSTSHIQAPVNFAEKVMTNLPKEKKSVGYKRWFKAHPIVTAAAVFFLFMLSSIMSVWSQDDQLKVTVSNQENLIIQDNTVIVPEGKVIKGDLVVENGNLKIEGKVEGNVLLINGENLLASAGEVTGKIDEVNQIFEWVWYHMKKTAKDLVSFTHSLTY